MPETYKVTKIDKQYMGWYKPGKEEGFIVGGIIATLESETGQENVRFNCNQNPESCPVFNSGMESCDADNIATSANREIHRTASIITCGHIPDFKPHLPSISTQIKKLENE